jgi:hypothetical protein
MSTTIRQQLLDVMTTALKTLPGVTVYTDDPPPLESTVFPAIYLIDGEATVDVAGSEMGRQLNVLTFELKVGGAGRTCPAETRALMGDVVALLWINRKWGGLARMTDITAHSLELTEAARLYAVGNITASVSYLSPLGTI